MSIFRSITLSSLVFAFALTANAEIDLTPTVHEYMAEGIKYRELIFKDGKRTISMELPNNWTYHYSADHLQLTPPQTKFTEGFIQAVPLAKPQPFDEATKKNLVQQVHASAPPNSDALTVEEKENPAPFSGNESFEVVVCYKTMGYTFQSSTIFVNCPETQLIFRFTAPKADFEALNKVFRRTIVSWQWIEPHNPVKE